MNEIECPNCHAVLRLTAAVAAITLAERELNAKGYRRDGVNPYVWWHPNRRNFCDTRWPDLSAKMLEFDSEAADA